MEVPPKIIGRYEILKEIGRGMMGIVYEAQDPALGRIIALKTIALSLAVRDEEVELFEQRFFAEARIAARLSHPGIVVVHDVGRDPQTGILYIAMERLHGRTLAEVIRDGARLEWRESLFLVLRLAEALQHAHAQNVIHRDLKPANVVVLRTGEPKILDFGLAKAETARIKLTTHGQVFGTPLFMSPEQALGRDIDARSDLFSLGAVAYNLLTGRSAFAASNVTDILKRVVESDPEPPSRVVAGLPPEVDRIVARALAKDVSARYPDAKTMAHDIRGVLGELSPPEDAMATTNFGTKAPVADSKRTPNPHDVGVATRPGGDLQQELETLISGLTPLPDAEPVSTRTIPPGGHKRGDPGGDTSPVSLGKGLGLAALAGLATAIVVGLVAWRFWPEGLALPQAGFSAPPAPSAAASPAPLTSPPSADPMPAPATPTAVASSRPRKPLAAATPAATPEPAPSPPTIGPASVASAQIDVDFDHSLKTGTLRVFVDGKVALDEDLESRAERNFVGLKKRKGSVGKTIALQPGRRMVRVEVAWDDNVKEERVAWTFKAGESRRLEIRLGRLRKNLSVEWK